MDRTFQRIDPSTLDFTGARLAQKTAWVSARPAREGERIITTPGSSPVETANIATATDMVITNAAGERYLIEARTFVQRYGKTGTAGMYQPRDQPIAVITVSEDIEFVTSWGQVVRVMPAGRWRAWRMAMSKAYSPKSSPRLTIIWTETETAASAFGSRGGAIGTEHLASGLCFRSIHPGK